jgi:hypothetical protein
MATSDSADALVAALLELDRYVGREGWDQPPRLFALVLTDVLAEAEPALSRELGLRTTEAGGLPHALTAIEQDEFRSSGDLTQDLAGVEWPETVHGCALTTVRTFLPVAFEADLPSEPTAAAAAVAEHPERQEIRVVVGVDRAGNRHGVGRLASRPEELLGAPDLVPGLASALAHTLC